MDRLISGGVVDFVGPCVNDGLAIGQVDGGEDAFAQFLQGGDADVAKDRGCEL
jgi:hypothetical protein